jgi:hypothetical protein
MRLRNNNSLLLWARNSHSRRCVDVAGCALFAKRRAMAVDSFFFYLKNAITPASALLYARERDMKMWSDVNIICFLCIAAINLAVGAKSVPIKNIFGPLY